MERNRLEAALASIIVPQEHVTMEAGEELAGMLEIYWRPRRDNVVGMPRTVHRGIMALLSLILNMGDGDGKPSRFLLKSIVYTLKGRYCVGVAVDSRWCPH